MTLSWSVALVTGVCAQDTESSVLAPLAPRSLLLDVVPLGGTLIAVGERGHVLRSEDGNEWTQLVVPTRRLLCAVAAVEPSLLWVVGHDAVILHSADAGRTWTIQHYAPEDEAPLFDIWFEDADHGLAVGAYGLILETWDGGASWEPRDVDDEGPHFFDVVEDAEGILYLAGEFGALWRSEDRGETWEALDSGYGGSIFGLLPTRGGVLLGYGLRGNVFRSTDGGQTFRRITTPTTAGLLGGAQLPDGRIVLVGLSGVVLTSVDEGLTFQSHDRDDRIGISGILPLASGDLLAFGESGVVPLDLTPGR